MHPDPADADERAAPREPSEQAPPSPRAPRTLRSEDLLHGECEVLIRHGDETYRLRRTRNGKLILHK